MVEILKAEKTDLKQILEIQQRAYISEAKIYNDYNLEPLRQTIVELENEFESLIILKAIINGDVIGSVRASKEGNKCLIGKLIVDPSFQNQGIGTKLMHSILALDTFKDIKGFELFTGHKSERNINLYKKLGFREYRLEKINEGLTLIYMHKEKDEKE